MIAVGMGTPSKHRISFYWISKRNIKSFKFTTNEDRHEMTEHAFVPCKKCLL